MPSRYQTRSTQLKSGQVMEARRHLPPRGVGGACPPGFFLKNELKLKQSETFWGINFAWSKVHILAPEHQSMGQLIQEI